MSNYWEEELEMESLIRDAEHATPFFGTLLKFMLLGSIGIYVLSILIGICIGGIALLYRLLVFVF